MNTAARHQKTIEPIAVIHTDFTEKFGIPRQALLVPGLTAWIEFLPPYGQPESIRGIEGYSHLWLVWGFSENEGAEWNATVRPPRLGGKTRVGVFATRSPFRPNGLGLSCVRLERVEYAEAGAGTALVAGGASGAKSPILVVGGADMLDGTPIYDIKPYIPLSDCVPNAAKGFSAATETHTLAVEFPPALLERVPPEKREPLIGVLAQDPRQTYFQPPAREYGMSFAGLNVKFTVVDAVPGSIGAGETGSCSCTECGAPQTRGTLTVTAVERDERGALLQSAAAGCASRNQLAL